MPACGPEPCPDLTSVTYQGWSVSCRPTAMRPAPRPAVSSDAGLTMAVYTAVPGSATRDALNLLAYGAATLDQAEAANAADGP